MKKIILVYILVLSVASSSVLPAYAAGNGICPYGKVGRNVELELVGKEISNRPVQIELSNTQLMVFMRVCYVGNIPNDLRHMYRAWNEGWDEFWNEAAANPDAGVHVTEGVAKVLPKVVPKGRAAVGVGWFSRTVGSLGMVLGSVVGSSCAVVIDMWTRGFSHHQRNAYLNRMFDHEISRWKVQKAEGENCITPFMSNTMQYGLNLLRHQLVGASQVLEIFLKVGQGEKIDFKNVDLGEDDQQELEKVFQDLVAQINEKKAAADAQVEADIEKIKRDGLTRDVIQVK